MRLMSSRAARRDRRGQAGAAAVELALVAPILVVLLAGIVDFGFRYQQHIAYTNAAMQSARTLAISGDTAEATNQARDFVSNTTATVTPTACPATITPGTNPVAVISIVGTRSTATGMFGRNFTIEATGSVRCP